jgi:hypothetical protein
VINDKAFRRLALMLPEAEERDHRGHPSFRVREKIFATLWPGEQRAVLKLTMAGQSDLVGSNPKAFSLNAWSKQGWTNVHLAEVTSSECRALLEEAWRMVAPKQVVRSFEKDRPS